MRDPAHKTREHDMKGESIIAQKSFAFSLRILGLGKA
jgi:hypothetical protein